MSVLNNQSDKYQEERAVKLQYDSKLNEALRILSNIYDRQKPETHGYAMMAMGLARVYKLSEKAEEEEKYLILAAMADTKLAVKENEALLTLAVNLYYNRDIAP